MTNCFDRIRANWLQCLVERVEAGRVPMDEASRIYDKLCATLEQEKRNHERDLAITQHPPLGQKPQVSGRQRHQNGTPYTGGRTNFVPDFGRGNVIVDDARR